MIDDSMPKLIGDWLRNVGSTHSKKAQANDAYQTWVIGDGFAGFMASQVPVPHIVEFLKDSRDKPRTHNAYLSMLRELTR